MPLAHHAAFRADNGAYVAVHSDTHGNPMVTWISADGTHGETITHHELPSTNPADIKAWARQQPWPQPHHIGPWSDVIGWNADTPELGRNDNVSLALLGILVTIALSVGFGVASILLTLTVPTWVTPTASVASAGAVGIGIGLLMRHPRTNRAIARIARSLDALYPR